MEFLSLSRRRSSARNVPNGEESEEKRMFSQAREVEKEVIIEKVSKPKGWTRKSNGAMRPCVHTTAANKTTLRSRYITPIIEKGRKADYRILTARPY